MKKFSRFIVIIISIAMIVALFSGCKQGKEGGDTSSAGNVEQNTNNATTNNAKKEEKPAEKLKLVWTGYINEPVAEDAVLIKKIEEKFNVEFEFLNIEHNNYEEQLNLKISSGEIPDSIRIPPEMFQMLYQQGVLKEIDRKLFEEKAPFIASRITEKFPDYWNLGVIDGKLYGIPAINSTNIFRLPIVYRKDWMEKLGISKTPETLEEFEKLMYAFAKNDPDGNGKHDTYGLSSDGLRLLFGAFGLNPGIPDGSKDTPYFHVEDGKVVFDCIDPDLKQALAYAAKWYKDGVLDPEFITGENRGGYWALSHSFIDGRIGFTVRGNFYHWAMLGDFKEMNEKGEWVDNQPGAVAKELLAKNPNAKLAFGQPVVGPTGKQGVKGWNMLMVFYCLGANVTPEKAAKIFEIWDFLGYRFACDDVPKLEEYLTWKYGPEGDYWKWADKSRGMYILTEKYWKEYPADSPIDNFGTDNMSPDVPYTPIQPIHEWAYKLGFDKGGLYSVIQVELPSMAVYGPNLLQMRDSAMIDIITGKKPLDYFDQYVEEMRAAGAEQIEKEANEWYKSSHQK